MCIHLLILGMSLWIYTHHLLLQSIYGLLEEAAFLHNFTKAQELVALSYLVCVYILLLKKIMKYRVLMITWK